MAMSEFWSEAWTLQFLRTRCIVLVTTAENDWRDIGQLQVAIKIIIVYYAEAAENIKHTHTIHAHTTKQFKHTNKNTYYVKSMR